MYLSFMITLDNVVAITLTAMFVLTGCYTMSYFYVQEGYNWEFQQKNLVVEILSDFGEHTYLSGTSKEKLSRFV